MAIAHLIAELGNDRDFAPVLTLETNEPGDLSVLTALVVRPADSPAAAAALERLRDEFLPQAFGDVSATALVTGPLAMQLDVRDSIWIWQIRIALLVLATSVIFLTLMFRTVVVPIVAALTTMLSVGAALGLLVLVVQKGHGASLLGLEQVSAIETWVPIVLFCIVFGLGMDYHVFLVSRIRERYRLTRDSTASITFGLRSTASVVCGAALIMVVVFGCFATGRLLMLQQVGFGLAVAVAIDALLVRLVLVPATMIVLGRRNWYLPGFLRWIPGDKGV
jgi:RND superfamily putative drug exporter